LGSVPHFSLRALSGDFVMSGAEIIVFMTVISLMVIGIALIVDAKST
jgi:hypothetical protein